MGLDHFVEREEFNLFGKIASIENAISSSGF